MGRKGQMKLLLMHLLLLAAAVVLIYSNTFHHPFVFDDHRNITEYDKIRDVSKFLSLKSCFESRSIAMLSFALTYRFCKLDVFWYHMGNILIHLFASWTAYFLALNVLRVLPAGRVAPLKTVSPQAKPTGPPYRRTGSIRSAALFAALLFAVHPLQTQAVTYIIQRQASMAALFFMGSVLFFCYARTGVKKKRYFFMSAVCGLLAVKCKENAFCLPGVLLLVEFVLFDRTWKGWKRKLPWLGVLGLAGLFLGLHLMGVFHAAADKDLWISISEVTRSQTKISRWQYLCTQFSVISIYIRLLLFPVGQSLDWLYPLKAGFFDGLTPAALLFLAAVISGSVMAVKKYPLIALAAGWFFITLAIESSIFPIADAMFEHRLYLPMFAYALFVPWLVFRLVPDSRRRLGALLCVVLVVVLGAGTYMRNRVWRSAEILWKDVLKNNPRNYRAHNNLGRTLAREKRYMEAMPHIETSLSIMPDYAEALNNKGNVSLSLGDAETALQFSMKALQVRPSFLKAHQNVANALVALDRPREALPHYYKAVKTKQKNASVRNNLGLALAMLNRLDKAIRQYHLALKTEPDDPEILTNLGLALARKGRRKEAVTVYEEALEGNKEYAEAHHGLALTLAALGQTDQAEKHYIAAMRLKPDYAEACNSWGVFLTGQGRAEEAVRQYRKAIELDPAFAAAHNNLGAVLTQQGNIEEATVHFKAVLQLDPGFTNAHFNLGNVMTMMKRYREAIEHYREALRLNPELHVARTNMEVARKRLAAAQPER